MMCWSAALRPGNEDPVHGSLARAREAVKKARPADYPAPRPVPRTPTRRPGVFATKWQSLVARAGVDTSVLSVLEAYERGAKLYAELDGKQMWVTTVRSQADQLRKQPTIRAQEYNYRLRQRPRSPKVRIRFMRRLPLRCARSL